MMSDVASVRLLESLTGRIDMMNSALTDASAAIERLQDCNNFPADRDNAVTAITELTDATGIPTISLLREIATTVEHEARLALHDDYSGERAVTGAGLVQVNSWLPTDRLEQFAYLDPFKFASAVHEVDSIATLVTTIHPEKFMHVEPTEMHARQVLTRTYAYIQVLMENDEDEWVWATFRVGADAAEIFETSIQSQLHDMVDTISSDAMQKLAIATIGNPATMESYIACVEKMMNCIRNIHHFLGVMRELVDFYKELHDCIVKTREAVGEAYKCYLDDTAIQF